ncbi:MAG: phosphotransferase family protein [Deltaproteobacteria bacterium]
MSDGIDREKVSAWLEAEIPGLAPPFTFSLIAGGRSNLTFRVQDATGRLVVLRRPPLGAVLATPHDMAREYRIIDALSPTKVPVPPALGLCTDEAVGGAPFYVMDYVPGVVLGEAGSGEDAFDASAGRRAMDHLIEVLADLHAVDIDAIGLGDLAKKEAYLDRQLKRWAGQWEKSKQRELPAMEEAHALLVQAKPPQLYTGIVHGDYRLGNVLLAPEGRVAAVLDWELCTLGDTLADVGYLLNNWPDPADPPAAGAASVVVLQGCPSRAEFIAAYAERTGRAVGELDYYRAFQMWRLAAICEGVFARFRQKVMGDQKVDLGLMEAQTTFLANSALALARNI